MTPETYRVEAIDWLLSKLSAAKKKPSLVTPAPIKLPEMPKFPGAKTPEQRKKDLVGIKAKEIELWHTWKKSGEDPKHLSPLLKSMSNIVRSRVNVFSRAEVPTAAVEHEHKKKVVEALRTWDPKQGQLNTWVEWKMKNAGRYVEKYKNTARIPENISKHIGSYNAVKSELTENLGFEPDIHKIHEFVLKTKHPTLKGVSVKNLMRLEREQRKTFIDQGYDSDSDIGPAHLLSSREEEVAHLIMPQLTEQERTVHEFSIGLNGKPVLKPGAIAKKMKMDISKVSKLRTSIFNKMKPYLGAGE